MKGSRTVRFAITFILFFLNAYAYASPAQNESLHSSSPSMVRIGGHVLGALAKASKVQPPTDESKQPLTLTIVLKRDHQADFDSHLREIYLSLIHI